MYLAKPFVILTSDKYPVKSATVLFIALWPILNIPCELAVDPARDQVVVVSKLPSTKVLISEVVTEKATWCHWPALIDEAEEALSVRLPLALRYIASLAVPLFMSTNIL